MGVTVCNVEVVGACNLRCPTCPNGTEAAGRRRHGLMAPPLFERILAKLAEERPPGALQELALYNWGEPLLHPEIGRLVRAAVEAGYPTSLSTNLNDARHLEQALLARPTVLKVSTSGIRPASYARTHAGGDAGRVVANLRLVRALLDRHRLPTAVVVAYLVHRGNVGPDYTGVQDLCAELGFAFRPFWALLMPVERNVELLEGRPRPGDEALAATLPVHPRTAQAIAAGDAAAEGPCRLLEGQLAINHDGSVELCCGVHDLPPVAEGYLDLPLEALQARRRAHPYCARCRRQAVDRIITYAGGAALDAAALEALSGGEAVRADAGQRQH